MKILGVSETLFIPLYARAIETKRPDAIIKDLCSIKIVESIDFDFSKFDGAWITQLAVAVRTEIIDEVVNSFINRFPDALIINLGAGLCCRFYRVDNRILTWIELDLPKVGKIWHQLNNETDRHIFIECSVMDFVWMDKVKKLRSEEQNILFIAEGLLQYFSEVKVKQLIISIKNNFSGSEMLLKTIGRFMVSNTYLHDTVSKTNAKFKWGINSCKEMESWDSEIKYINEWNLIDRHKDRWKWLNIFKLPFLKKQFPKIGYILLGKKE